MKFFLSVVFAFMSLFMFSQSIAKTVLSDYSQGIYEDIRSVQLLPGFISGEHFNARIISNHRTNYDANTDLSSKIRTSPNPSKGFVFITWDQSLDNQVSRVLLTGFNSSVSTELLIDVKKQSASVDLSTYPQGLYAIQIETLNGKTVSKTLMRN